MNKPAKIAFWALLSICALQSPAVLAGSEKIVEMKGIIQDHFRKKYPFLFRSGSQGWILDVIEVPKDKIGKEVLVKGRVIRAGQFVLLTEVFIDGVRFQTPREWHDSRKQRDPLTGTGVHPWRRSETNGEAP